MAGKAAGSKCKSGARAKKPGPKKKAYSKLSPGAKSLRNNPKARKAKAKNDAKNNSKSSQVQKRTESDKARRDAKKSGKNIKGKDYDHATNSFTSSERNRGRSGEGNRKKGVKRGKYKSHK